MLTRTFDHALNRMLTLMRELFLILAVGILGSQFLILINGGPIGADAQASFQTMGFIPISSLEIDLNPSNPTTVRSVYVHLVDGYVDDSTNISISATDEISEVYLCHAHTNVTWHCTTPGLRTIDLEVLVVSEF